MEFMDWKDCDLVEEVPGKANGAPVIKGTRIFADTIPESFEMSLEEGTSPEDAIAELNEDYPSAGGVLQIKRLLDYYFAHQPQPWR